MEEEEEEEGKGALATMEGKEEIEEDFFVVSISPSNFMFMLNARHFPCACSNERQDEEELAGECNNPPN